MIDTKGKPTYTQKELAELEGVIRERGKEKRTDF